MSTHYEKAEQLLIAFEKANAAMKDFSKALEADPLMMTPEEAFKLNETLTTGMSLLLQKAQVHALLASQEQANKGFVNV